MNWNSEYIAKFEIPKAVQDFEKFLSPQKKGFKLIHSGLVPNSLPSILYQSHQCKMRIQCLRDRPYEDIEMYLSYGRLHAPLDQDIIEWNHEKCYCWHSLEISPILYFLDGLSPAEAAETRLARIAKEFSELRRDKSWTVPEYWARRHAFIWDHYGQQLFDLFDLGYPDMWEEYVRFLREFDRIKKEKSTLKIIGIDSRPPSFKVC